MKRKIYVSACLLSVLTIILTAILTLAVCYKQFANQIKNELKNEAELLTHQLSTEGNYKEYLFSISNASKRITLIGADGEVIYDNSADASKMENHSNRPEFSAAKKYGFAEVVRLSDTLKRNTFYYAVLLDSGYVLRISSTTDSIFSVFLGIIPYIVFIILILLVFALFFAMRLTKNIINPINKINLENLHEEEIYDELLPFIKKISQQNEKISKQMEQIKAQRDRLNIISENMNEGLIVLDRSGMVLSINKSALKMFGLSNSDLNNKSFLHLNRNLDIIDFIKTALTGVSGTQTLTVSKSTYELIYSPVFENGVVYGAILLFFDISEKERAEKIRREFSANVSHELKTPITTILGYSQMINNGMARQEDINGFALKIEKEAKRLINLIEDIIKLSSLDEQKNLIEKQSVNILNIAKEVISNLESNIKEKNISVNIEGSDTFIYGNLPMLEELIYNLCDNAVKYNKEGGSINIVVKDKTISIADTGIGIAKEHQERIFERFYRVDKSRSRKVSGTGLGLSIVKHIALFHNAEIEIESELGKGTKIAISFRP